MFGVCIHTTVAKVIILSVQNRELQEENRLLRQQTDTLASEKWRLAKQLKHQDQAPVTRGWLQPLGKRSTSESGSAVPITPLQQEQILRALLAHVLAILRFVQFICVGAVFVDAHRCK